MCVGRSETQTDSWISEKKGYLRSRTRAVPPVGAAAASSLELEMSDNGIKGI